MGRLTAFRETVYPSHMLPLSPGAAFSLDVARTLAWASQLAYEVDATDKFQRIARGWQWSVLGAPRQTTGQTGLLDGIKGFVAKTGAATILAFAGTEPDSLRNWITDVRFRHRATDGISAGFYDDLDMIWNEVDGLIGQAGNKPLYITGHSLGGALAVVSGWRLSEAQRAMLAGIYTFGMPRTGSARFADDYHAPARQPLGDRTFRLRHGDDVVPTVAPTWFGSRHVGRLLHCAHGGVFDARELGPMGPEQPSAIPEQLGEVVDHVFRAFRTSALPAFPGETPAVGQLVDHLPRGARDHLMDRYLWALNDASVRALGA